MKYSNHEISLIWRGCHRKKFWLWDGFPFNKRTFFLVHTPVCLTKFVMKSPGTMIPNTPCSPNRACHYDSQCLSSKLQLSKTQHSLAWLANLQLTSTSKSVSLDQLRAFEIDCLDFKPEFRRCIKIHSNIETNSCLLKIHSLWHIIKIKTACILLTQQIRYCVFQLRPSKALGGKFV